MMGKGSFRITFRSDTVHEHIVEGQMRRTGDSLFLHHTDHFGVLFDITHSKTPSVILSQYFVIPITPAYLDVAAVNSMVVSPCGMVCCMI